MRLVVEDLRDLLPRDVIPPAVITIAVTLKDPLLDSPRCGLACPGVSAGINNVRGSVGRLRGRRRG